MTDFSSKIVWISGASSGIGEALAYLFNQKGSKIIISSRREKELERVKKNCQQPEKIKILPLDLAKHNELIDKAEQAFRLFGRIDILINNGGISQRALALETQTDVDKKIMDINYFGNMILSKAVLPRMIEQGGGTIVVTTSLLGKFGTPLRSAYAASKHALHGFYDSLRSEVYDKNIQILLLVPGYIKTNVSINALTADGTPQNSMDKGQENGMLPAKFAELVLKAIEKGREELLVGGKETFGVYLKRFFPKFFSKFIPKQNVK